jgi:hypothetical protein
VEGDWATLKFRPCVKIKLLPHRPKYIRLLNTSDEIIQLTIALRPPKAATLTLRPKATSRIVEYRALADKRRVRTLVAGKRLTVAPVYEIGPAIRGGDVRGVYYGEDVYSCYECGGAIVFRGSPPTPIHV